MAQTLLGAIQRGDLVRILPRQGQFVGLGSGLTQNVGEGAAAESNESGYAMSLQATVNAGVANQGGGRFPFYGSTIGVILRRDQNAAAVPPDFAIDGRVFTGTDPRLRFYNQAAAGITDAESLIVIDTGIPPTRDGRPHTLDVMQSPDIIGAAQYKLVVLGLLVERSAGYRPITPSNQPLAPIAVPTTAAAIATKAASAGEERRLRNVRQVVYTNTTAGALAVTVFDNAVQAWAGSVPANGSLTFDFGGPTVIDGARWTHVAAGAGVNYTVIGGW